MNLLVKKIWENGVILQIQIYFYMSVSIESPSELIDLLASSWTEEAKKSFKYILSFSFSYAEKKEEYINWWLLKRHWWFNLGKEKIFQSLYWSWAQVSYECSSLLTKNYGSVAFPVSSMFSQNLTHIVMYNRKIIRRSECCKKYV